MLNIIELLTIDAIIIADVEKFFKIEMPLWFFLHALRWSYSGVKHHPKPIFLIKGSTITEQMAAAMFLKQLAMATLVAGWVLEHSVK
ncbi:hypothetical protein WICPIJ_002313 [Wickerhamomyces pijperi]|uniref:Uncharacterized protein n=1 Tax=Wickerhamomyces pijperi TaxID=599730 RepID=A0A9P8QBZ1_WICPI|nr:hypothetical protein WICPIJ_002313 [Wickerhamomyces pijperi]